MQRERSRLEQPDGDWRRRAGGMVSATIIAIFSAPVSCVFVLRFAKTKTESSRQTPQSEHAETSRRRTEPGAA